MDNLKEVLREVLKEELDPILKRMDGIDQRFTVLVNQVNRFEQTQQEHVIGLLNLINRNYSSQKVDQEEHRIDLLNQRLLKTEADVRKLMTS